MLKSRGNPDATRMPALYALLARLRTFAPFLILAACAQPVPVAQPTRAYVSPTASSTSARLVMRNAIDKADRSYEVAVFDDADKCSGRQRVGVGSPTTDPETTRIAAGRWQTIETIAYQPNRMMCRMRWSFVPVAGRSYLVNTTSKPTGCMTVIYDMTNPEALRIEPSLRRREVSNNLCLPLAQAEPVKLNAAKKPSDANDLPIPSETHQAPSASTSPGGTSVDDLQGLIGH
jgi:hypothetical protein